MMTENDLQKLEKLAIPIANFLKEKGYAYPSVVITPSKVTLTTDEAGIPLLCEATHDDMDVSAEN